MMIRRYFNIVGLSIAIVLLFCGTLRADDVDTLVVGLRVDQKSTFTFQYLRQDHWQASPPLEVLNKANEYSAVVVDAKGQRVLTYPFEVDFHSVIIEDLKQMKSYPPPAAMDIILRIPVLIAAGTFIVEKDGRVLLEQPFNLCEKNGQCDGFESYFSCPDDCPRWAKDGICVSGARDLYCDPDCGQTDMDCRLGSNGPPPGMWDKIWKWMKINLTSLWGLIGLVVFLMIISLWIFRKLLKKTSGFIYLLILLFAGLVSFIFCVALIALGIAKLMMS